MNNDLGRLTVRPLTDFAQLEKLYADRLKKDFARNELLFRTRFHVSQQRKKIGR